MVRSDKPSVTAVLALLAVLAAAGCGSVRTRWQKVPVTSVPTGARVFVDGRAFGQAPVTIWLNRKNKEHVIRIEAPGYDTTIIRSERMTNGAVLLGDFLLGLVPAFPIAVARSLNDHDDHFFAYAAAFGMAFTLIDLSQGTTNDVRPKEIVVTLVKTEGEERVRTVLIGADDMRNLTWIRVRQ